MGTVYIKDDLENKIAHINSYLQSSNCSDFRLRAFDGSTLSLVGSFDLCYYHEIEVIFHEVHKIAMETYFSASWEQPVFRLVYPHQGLYEVIIADDSDQQHSIVCEGVDYKIETVKYHND